MDTLDEIKKLVEKISIDTEKVRLKGNHSASIRARKNAQQIKVLIPQLRKEILTEIQSNNKKTKN